MKLGLLLGTQSRGDIVALWESNLRLAEVAERVGFASIHVPEHHARSDNYLPQPLVACAAIAARTSRILIGPTVLIPALRHPLHLAEEAAVVDVLSNGRLVLGLGIGNFQPEFEMFGLNKKYQAELFNEHLEILTGAWGADSFSFHGKHLNVNAIRVTPSPVQRQLPLWIGAMSKRGCERAARFGATLVLDPLNPVENLIPLADHYRREAARFGFRPSVVLLRWGWLADSISQIEKDWWPSIREIAWLYSEEIPRLRIEETSHLETQREPEDLAFDDYRSDRLLVGDPTGWTDQLHDWQIRLNVEHVIVRLNGPSSSMRPEATREVVEAIGSDIISHLADCPYL